MPPPRKAAKKTAGHHHDKHHHLAGTGWGPGPVGMALTNGCVATDEIRLVIGYHVERGRVQRDQDNALEAWPEHGLLGTQLGPNKNGKKW